MAERCTLSNAEAVRIASNAPHLLLRQETVSRGLTKMGANRAAAVVLGPVTWVHLARHANAQASEKETVALKKQYLEALLPVYEVKKKTF